MTSILAFIQALPALIGLLKELFEMFKEMKANKEKEDVIKFIMNTSSAIKEVKNAKSPDEKTAAAIRLRALIHQL